MATLDRNVAIMEDAAGRRFRRVAKYTGPASYPALGDPFVPGDVSLSVFDMVPSLIAFSAAGAIRFVVYDYTNKTYRWFTDAATEIVAGVDLSTFSTRGEWVGY
jgi:hypothetical protein